MVQPADKTNRSMQNIFPMNFRISKEKSMVCTYLLIALALANVEMLCKETGGSVYWLNGRQLINLMISRYRVLYSLT